MKKTTATTITSTSKKKEKLRKRNKKQELKTTMIEIPLTSGGAPDGSEQGKRTVKFVVVVDRCTTTESDGQSCR